MYSELRFCFVYSCFGNTFYNTSQCQFKAYSGVTSYNRGNRVDSKALFVQSNELVSNRKICSTELQEL